MTDPDAPDPATTAPGLAAMSSGFAQTAQAAAVGEATAFDRRMLEALVCPQTQGLLRYDARQQELISDQAQLAFPIRDGIPIMLISAARMLK